MLTNVVWSWRSLVVVLAFVLLGTACASSATPTAEPTPPPQLPETSGAAVWSYLQSVNYRDNWQLWPGKGKLYQGTAPHGMLLTTYLSPNALAAVTSKAGAMPDRTIIVKENYMPDETLAATTVMYKVSGYNPEHHDWFFTKIKADNTVEAEGRVESCQTCHGSRKDNDYIFTGPLK